MVKIQDPGKGYSIVYVEPSGASAGFALPKDNVKEYLDSARRVINMASRDLGLNPMGLAGLMGALVLLYEQRYYGSDNQGGSEYKDARRAILDLLEKARKDAEGGNA